VKKIDEKEELKIEFEHPYDQGYILLPIRYLKQAKKFTKLFSISPNYIRPNNQQNRKVKQLLLVVDALNKEKIPITLESISQVLEINTELVKQFLNYAEELKCIQKELKMLKYEIKFKKKKMEASALVHKKSKTKRIIDYYYQKYFEKYGEVPPIDERDGIEAKRFGESYSFDDCSKLIDLYLSTNDIFPFTHELKYIRRNIGHLRFKQHINNETRRKKKQYKSEDYAEELEDWQLKDYLIGKLNKRWKGTEPWAKNYEIELKKRKIIEKDLTKEDYQRAKRLNEKE